MNKFIALIAVLFLLGTSPSCGLFKKSSRRKSMTPIGDSLSVAGLIPVMDSSVIIGDSLGIAKKVADSLLIESLLPLWNKQLVYTTFSGKARVHYEGKDQEQDFAASIRMERGKKIWVSITALGLVEVARLQITPDTIILINRLKKEVTILPFSEAGKLLPLSVDFLTLQGLLIGDVLHPSPQRPVGIVIGAEGFGLLSRDTNYQQSVLFSSSDSTLRQQQIIGGGGNKTTLLMQYDEYERTAERAFAKGRKINAQDSASHNYIELNFNTADFDQPVDFNFSIPSRYTQK